MPTLLWRVLSSMGYPEGREPRYYWNREQLGDGTLVRDREVYQQIIGEEEPEPHVSRFPRAGQNIVAATMLLRNMPEPSNSQARCIRDKVQGLLHVAAAQQAESSASRRRGVAIEKRVEPARNEREVSVHQGPPRQRKKTVTVQEHLVDNRGQHNARHDINEHHHHRHGDAEEHGYNAHCWQTL